MTNYPLLFGMRNLLAGNGFVAGVAVDGRALLVDEGDGFWIYGVNPGGIAAGGRNEADAIAAFRSIYQSVLFDIASETETFEAFKTQVEEFVHSTNEPMAEDWKKAARSTRKARQPFN